MKYLIAVPCMDMMHTSFVQSLLSMERPGESQYVFARNSLVYDSRNMLCIKAINDGFDRVLWIDSDMVFESNLMLRLAADMDGGRDFVTAITFKRQPPHIPVIYKTQSVTENADGTMTPHAAIYENYPRDEIFQIMAAGFGCVMTSVDLLKRVHEEFGQPFTPAIGFGEDLSFCARVSRLGVPMWCDSKIKVGHCSELIVTEANYGR